MHRIVLLLVPILMAGCASVAGPIKPGKVYLPATLSDAEKKAVQDGVRKVLMYPDGARFGEFIAAKADDDTATYVCGFVNARDRSGGYPGDEPFIGLLMSDTERKGTKLFSVSYLASSNDQVASYVPMECRNHGIMLP